MRSPRLQARAALLILVIAGTLLDAGSSRAAEGDRYRGRRLVEVLEELRAGGLDIIYSSAVVRRSLRVSVEPAATTPRGLLEEILGPLGLSAEDGPSGSVLIVPAGTGTLTGRVAARTGERPIAGAYVRLPGTAHRALTTEDGTFTIRQVTAGTYLVIIDAAGFTTATVESARIEAEEETALAIDLDQDPEFVTAVVVIPDAHSVMRQEVEATRSVEGGEAILAPSIGGDISRVIELLPGVAAPDNSAAFNIRGSLARDASMVLDGLELYDPFHLQGFQSPFSLIDTNVVDSIDFLGGGFTAELGDRHGGFVEITTVGPVEAGKGEIELGTLNSRASYSSAFPGGGGSWLASARAWYPEAFRDTTELGEGEELDPRFQDLYLKMAFDLSERQRLSIHGLAAQDEMFFQETGEEVNEEIEAQTRNWYAWVRSLSAWTEDLTSETILSGGRIDRVRDGLSSTQDDPITIRDERIVDFYGLKHDSVWRVSDVHAIKLGADVRALDAEYDYSNIVEGDPAASSRIDLEPDGTSFAAYAAYRARLATTVVTELGLRWDRQTHTDDDQVSPRFNMVWKPAPRSEIRLAAGRFGQSERIHELQVEDGETEFTTAEISEQAELSVQQLFGAGLRLRVDAYYRRLTDLRPRHESLFEPIELFPETTDDRVLIAPDEARLRGVEFLFGNDPADPFYWWVSYVRSSAEETEDGRDIPRSWDQPHAGRFLVSYRRDERWSVSLSGSAHTGWPTTPVRGETEVDPNGETEIVEETGERNSRRFEDYFRLDFKARRSIGLPRGRLWLTLEIVNLTNRENQCCVDEFLFEERPDGSVDVETLYDHWLGITPTVSVLWEF